MIGYLHGKVTGLFPDMCFIEVNGVGYRVFVSSSTRTEMKLGQELTVYTYLNVREDALLLYGFPTQAEYDIFNHLISVSGIGPKAALSILSVMSAEKIIWAIQNKQTALLATAPGVGKKTSERIILELKDKLSNIVTDEAAFENDSMNQPDAESDSWTDARQALLSLGYTQQEIANVLKKAQHLTSAEEIIKFALKELSR